LAGRAGLLEAAFPNFATKKHKKVEATMMHKTRKKFAKTGSEFNLQVVVRNLQAKA